MSLVRAAIITAVSSALSLQGMSTAHASPAETPVVAPGAEAEAPGPDAKTAPPGDAAEESGAGEGTAPEGDGDHADEPVWLQDALRQEAYDRFVEGKEFFDTRRYLKAAAAFERSFAAVPVGRALYNMGLSYEKGGDIVRALDAYTRYTELPDCPAPEALCADKRDEVQETIRRLKTQVGVLTIVLDDGVDPRGIDIDGRTVQLDDFPLILEPGSFELRIRGRKRGQVQIRRVQIEAGQRASLVIPGFDEPAAPAVSPRVTPRPDDRPPRITPEERKRRLRLAFYGGLGLTGLSAVAMSVTGGIALGAFRRQDERCKGEGMACPDTVYPAEDRDTVTRMVPVTNVFVGVTAGLGLTTLVVGLFAFSRTKGEGGTSKRASTRRVQPSPAGLRVRF